MAHSSRMPEAGSWKLEAGCRRLEAGASAWPTLASEFQLPPLLCMAAWRALRCGMRLQTTTRHCLICGIERETPEPLLEGFARAPELIADALAHATAAGHAGWTPAEVVSHLADTEMNFGARIRQVLAEDEPLLTSYDQERWARALEYARRDPALALETFGVCRAASI